MKGKKGFQVGHPFYGDLTKLNFRKGHPKPKNAYKFPIGYPKYGKGTLGKHWKLPKNIYKGQCFNTGRTHIKEEQHLSPATEFKKGRISPNKGRIGKNSFNWKGGITPLPKIIRESERYKKWREAVFLQDNFICWSCGERGGYLEAHHIKTLLEILKENNIKNMREALHCKYLWDIKNGRTLCKKCHDLTKRGRIKKT